MIRNSTIFGLIGGFILASSGFLISPFMGNEASGTDWAEILGFSIMIVAFSTIFFGIRNHREKNLGGYITFWEAMKTGGFIALIGTVMYVIGWMIFINTVGEGSMDGYFENQVKAIQESGQSAEEIQLALKQAEEFRVMYQKPHVMAFFTFIEPLPVTVPLLLISSFILKKKSPAEELKQS